MLNTVCQKKNTYQKIKCYRNVNMIYHGNTEKVMKYEKTKEKSEYYEYVTVPKQFKTN